MRLTRAAQRAQQGDETNDAPEVKDRAVLNEISHNASPEHVQDTEDLPKKTPSKKVKGKATKKGGKGKKTKNTEADEEEPVQAPLEDESATAADPANNAASAELAADPSADKNQDTTHNERPATPSAKPVRLTRRQLALQEEEAAAAVAALKQSQETDALPKDEEQVEELQVPEECTENDDAEKDDAASADAKESASAPELVVEEPSMDELAPAAQKEEIWEEHEAGSQHVEEVVDTAPAAAVEEEQSDASGQIEEQQGITPSVEVTAEPEPKTLAADKPSDECARTPIISRTSSSRRASRSPSKSPMRIEESFEALDALEEALENVVSVTSFDRAIEEKSPRKKTFPRTLDEPVTNARTPRKTPVATRVSKTPNTALKSMKPTTTSQARPSSLRVAGPARELRKPSADILLARSSSLRIAPRQELRKPWTETSDYLASKRRPVSVSFPTPPPPPKGRAPTKSTFHLSSDDVVAKLKAQKEERAKREAHGVPAPKQRPISMPPPPKSSKPVTKPDFKLPGEEIAEKLKARKEERLARLQNGVGSPRQSVARPTSMIVQPPKSTKPPTKAVFELPGAAVAEKLRIQREERMKRMEEAEAAKKEAAAKARAAPVRKPSVTIPLRQQQQQQPGVSIHPPPTSQTQAQRSTSLASKRSSVVLQTSRSTSTSSANRNSAIVTKSIVTPDDAAAQKVKGREVFNRIKAETDEKERERKDKEEAAKKARAEAAERGRIASREWAERQRKKLMGGA